LLPILAQETATCAMQNILNTLLQDERIGRTRLADESSSGLAKDQVSGFLVENILVNQNKIQLRAPQDAPETAGEHPELQQGMACADLSHMWCIEQVKDLTQKVFSFEIDAKHVGEVRKACDSIGYPLLEEYDFRKDNVTANLNANLKPAANIRSYQEKSLSKMFGNGTLYQVTCSS
jgi:DNA excision repair protein ERCC-3